MRELWKGIKKDIRNLIKFIVGRAIQVIIIFTLFIPITFLYFRYKELPELANTQNLNLHYAINLIDEYTLWYYICLILMTAALAFIAWFQLNKLINKLRAEYLLEVDKRWHSKQIINARVVIHKLYLKSKRHIKDNALPEESLICTVGKEIILLSDSNDESKIKDFIYLLNFLDFMESISYFHTKKHLTIKQIDELFGLSLKFNYEIFKPYIEHRRISHHNISFYSEFEKLYHELCRV